MRFEGGELHCPEAFNFLKPVSQRLERLRFQPIQADARIVINVAVLDQTAFAQNAQVTTQARRAHLQSRSEVAGSSRLLAK